MSIDFFELFKETVLISIAKRKIAEGVELTEEEKDKILQQIYSAARKEIKDGKELRSTKAKIVFKTLSIVSKMMGEKGKGYHDASVAVTKSTKNNVDNYKRVLQGVEITSKNQIMENFQTLIAQYEASEDYGRIMGEFVMAFMEVNNSYKKDYQAPIGTELVDQMEDKREEVLDLDTKYIKK